MAKHVKYHCTHCGRAFETEEREIVECPGCFWSTSVRRAENSAPFARSGASVSPASPGKKRLTLPAFNLRRMPFPRKKTIIALAVILLAGVGFFIAAFLSGLFWVDGDPFRFRGEKAEEPAPMAVPAQESHPEREAGLTAPLREVLWREVSKAEAAHLTEEEIRTLEQEVPFRTGFVRQLPSAAWRFEDFEEMLREQEAFYQISFPRSYRRQLTRHFRETYPSAASSFEEGDLLDARDGWVAFLAFPLYSNDLQKHRGVALTILRPVINDTLSKIGALNSMLLEERFRSHEKEIHRQYRRVIQTIQEREWRQAVEQIKVFKGMFEDFQTASAKEAGAPPYPEDILAGVDRDIKMTLFDLSSVPNPAIADFRPMLKDIRDKNNIIKGHIPENFERSYAGYKQALSLIHQEEWKDALKALKGVDSPAILERDAREKIAVLEKHRALANA